jgi:hypothetical protein
VIQKIFTDFITKLENFLLSLPNIFYSRTLFIFHFNLMSQRSKNCNLLFHGWHKFSRNVCRKNFFSSSFLCAFSLEGNARSYGNALFIAFFANTIFRLSLLLCSNIKNTIFFRIEITKEMTLKCEFGGKKKFIIWQFSLLFAIQPWRYHLPPSTFCVLNESINPSQFFRAVMHFRQNFLYTQNSTLIFMCILFVNVGWWGVWKTTDESVFHHKMLHFHSTLYSWWNEFVCISSAVGFHKKWVVATWKIFKVLL